MPKLTIPISVTGSTQTLALTGNHTIRAGSKNYWFAVFTFKDNVFDGLEYLTATFSNEPYELNRGRAKLVPVTNNEAQVPWEVLRRKGKVYVGLFAGDMLVTNEVVIDVTEAAPTLGDPSNPSPSWYAPFEAEIAQKVDKEIGKGLSSNDYTDTEKAKLASIPDNLADGRSPYVGANGHWFEYDDTQAEYVDTGIVAQGSNGESAYEIAVDNGFSGTESEWLASLKGADGQDGQDGTDGTNGADGYSPTASVSKSGGTATITITDKNGTTSVTVTDGADGQDGQDGQNGADGQDGADGYSPTATVSKSGSVATISITDKNGATTATVSDGADGNDGVMWATYGTTTTAQIAAAITANKTVLMWKDHLLYYLDREEASVFENHYVFATAPKNAVVNKCTVSMVGRDESWSTSTETAILAPSNPTTGAFLTWNGSAWVAQTLATWQGGSY